MTRSSLPSTPAGASASSPLVFVRDPWLRDRVLLLCAAAGADAETVEDDAMLCGQWRSAPCLLLDTETAAAAVPDPSMLSRRDGVAIVTREASATVWQSAVAVGAEHVFVLPTDEDTVAGWVADRLETGLRALVVAVTGARGGAGASTFAATLATTAAAHGPVCLVDGDPMSGGIDLVLGDEAPDGVRWPELTTTAGRLSGRALRDGLPVRGGVSVLTWPRRETVPVPARTMASLLTAARRSYAVVVVDLPRGFDPSTEAALAAADSVLLVTTNDIRAVAAGATHVPWLRERASGLGVVVRATSVGAIPAHLVAEGLGAPLVAVIPTRRAIARRIDDGGGTPRRGQLVRRCRDVLDLVTDLRRSSAVDNAVARSADRVVS